MNVTVRVFDVPVQRDYEPEVRRRHHDCHSAEHVNDGDGVRRPARESVERAQHHQPSLHRRLHRRVRHQTHRSAALLFQTAMERLRLHRRSHVHTR